LYKTYSLCTFIMYTTYSLCTTILNATLLAFFTFILYATL